MTYSTGDMFLDDSLITLSEMHLEVLVASQCVQIGHVHFSFCIPTHELSWEE